MLNKLNFEDWSCAFIQYNNYDPNKVIYQTMERQYTLFQFFAACIANKGWQDTVRNTIMTCFSEYQDERAIDYMRTIIENALNEGYIFTDTKFTF